MDITSYLLGKQAGGGSEVNLQDTKQVTITENTMTEVIPDTGYDAVKKVQVTTNVSGGGGHDWSTIGYEEEPSSIGEIYDYAKDIYDDWDATQTSLYQKFRGDTNLVVMPLVNTSSATDMSGMFQSCSNLVDVPLINVSNVTNISNMFQSCIKLKNVPLFDTSSVTNMANTFKSCSNLKNVPLFNTSNVKGTNAFQNTFSECINLTDQSLDNILQMCINATSYVSTKTFARLGFIANAYPASRIEALPHYQDFLNAGWTIGY